MAYRVEVDQDLCMSSGKCVADAPQVFAFDEDEIAEVRAEPGEVSDEKLVEIARNCPSGAIRLLEGDREVLV
ncbi:(4Fe-4S)-binding protein [Mumia sp. ZJ1417]|uniref:ferredoxin n=1 Tax=Mumia sp. ZJ1417 TaxID=2708082 RepID=UPI00141EEB66|nr:(4Fe-4S)-binding protein [Mumia sp. ZJ1417]QMW65829.1 (4Fe-4S)-binding protein [Mumia sp. ZJ1417]